MNPFRLFAFKANSAPQARERLQLLLSHERALDVRSDRGGEFFQVASPGPTCSGSKSTSSR